MAGCGEPYGELLNNGRCTEHRSRLEGKHGVIALSKSISLPAVSYLNPRHMYTHVECREGLPVGIEGIVVELDELL